MTTVIDLKNVSFSYTQKYNELNSVSLHVKAGECVVVTGPSGCGKTTLTRILNGLIPHYFEGKLTGTVKLNGVDVTELNAWEYGKITGSVFQDARTQFFTSHVLDELAFTSENYGIEPHQISVNLRKSLIKNNITHLSSRELSELSSGEKQKVATAAIEVHQPKIYILDEPSANLDPKSCVRLLNTVKRLKKEGNTILIADHRIEYLKDVLDFVVYLNHGELRHTWTNHEYFKLSNETLSAFGLRPHGISIDETKVKSAHAHNMAKISLLKVSNLGISVSRKRRILQDNLNFSLDKGQILVLTGTNGVGKTTLAKTLCGLIKERNGSISVNGRKTTRRKRYKHFWFVHQDADYQLFSDNVYGEIMLGHRKNTTNFKNAEGILTDLDLFALKERHPATLSGGQKQRLTFAIGLMRRPDILILDEPTSGLDAKNMAQVVKLIQTYAHLGVAFIIISHDEVFIRCLDAAIIDLN